MLATIPTNFSFDNFERFLKNKQIPENFRSVMSHKKYSSFGVEKV